MFIVRKYTHHLRSSKRMKDYFEKRAIFNENKKNFSWFMESVWNLHLYSKSGLIVTF